jgi:hypothetical protein
VSDSEAVLVVELPPSEVVAVTIIVYVPGGVPGVAGFDAGSPPPDPHAAMPTANPATSVANRSQRTTCHVRLVISPRIRKIPLVSHNKHNRHAQASAAPLAVGPVGGSPRGTPKVAATVGTLTVNYPAAVGDTCTDAEFEAGFVTIAQGPISAPAGTMEHDKFTVPVNPPAYATSKSYVAV